MSEKMLCLICGNISERVHQCVPQASQVGPETVVGSWCSEHPCQHREGEEPPYGMHQVMIGDLDEPYKSLISEAQGLREALKALYEVACLAYSETGKMNPPSMMGQKRLAEMRDLLLEKIGLAEKALSKINVAGGKNEK